MKNVFFFHSKRCLTFINIKSIRFIDFKNSSTSIESFQNHYYFNWLMTMYWVNRLLIFEIQLKKIHILWSMSNCWAVWTLYKMRFRFQSFFLHIFRSDIFAIFANRTWNHEIADCFVICKSLIRLWLIFLFVIYRLEKLIRNYVMTKCDDCILSRLKALIGFQANELYILCEYKIFPHLVSYTLFTLVDLFSDENAIMVKVFGEYFFFILDHRIWNAIKRKRIKNIAKMSALLQLFDLRRVSNDWNYYLHRCK